MEKEYTLITSPRLMEALRLSPTRANGPTTRRAVSASRDTLTLETTMDTGREESAVEKAS